MLRLKMLCKGCCTMMGTIFEIKRFAVHDGNGIRTTVFFKGCPLKCVWCHNPEGISFEKQMAYMPEKCINCGECVKVCPSSAHRIVNNLHVYQSIMCTSCGKCEEICLSGALKKYGEQISIQSLLSILLEDRIFYEQSGGGVTLSGGECLCQADFCEELLIELKHNGINTAVDTCGFVKRKAIEKVIPYTDIFLYDLKAIDENVHIKCTGKSNKLILDNLKYIDSCNKKIEIRIPFVPSYNAGEIKKIGEYLKNVKNLTKIKLLPYHNYAGSKYTSLAMRNTLPRELPQKEETDMAIATLKNMGFYVE